MKKLVLDAWAILAYLQGEEPAASHVKAYLAAAEVEFMLYRTAKIEGILV